MRRILQRVGLVIAIGGIAILCISSATLAAIVGIMIAVLVAIDMIAFARLAPPRPDRARDDDPRTLNVDLSRRR